MDRGPILRYRPSYRYTDLIKIISMTSACPQLLTHVHLLDNSQSPSQDSRRLAAPQARTTPTVVLLHHRGKYRAQATRA